MDTFTRRVIYIIMAAVLAFVVVMFTITSVHLVWNDGNTPLVTSIVGNMTQAFTVLVAGMASVVGIKDVASAIQNKGVGITQTVTTTPITAASVITKTTTPAPPANAGTTTTD